MSRAVVAGMDASTLLGALPVGLQLWEAAGDSGGLALRWSNHDDAREAGEEAARVALAGEAVDTVLDLGVAGYCRVRARPLGDGGVVVSFEDVTEMYRAEQLNASIVESLQEALLVADLGGRITRANQAAADLCGVSLGEIVGARLRDLPIELTGRRGQPIDPDGTPFRRALAGERVRGDLLRIVRGDGSALWVEVNASPLAEPDGTPYGALSTYSDVTGRVERERRIRAEADTDHLTGVANRRALQRMLTAALARAAAHGLHVGVLMLDLDGFKLLNDRFGHAAGDAALREVAERLRRIVRDRDLVARSGGDEFVIVLPDLVPPQNAAHDAAARVAAAFVEPLDLAGAQAPLHAAVGVACYPGDGDTLDDLLAAADRAMYARKAQ